MVLKKYEIEAALHAEKQEISAGRLKEDNPLDLSEDFRILCEACRRGNLKVCQEKITEGVNINARDRFDYTPLILASLCGHYEVVQLLLESGALCERDTFQGERCLYNALNNRIRNLLLSYDYSKSTDPLQPLAAHVTSLLTRENPKTSDITLNTPSKSFELHKFILAARSPYFAKKLATAPDATVSNSIPSQSIDAAIRYLYFSDINVDLGDGEDEQTILLGIEKISRQLEIERLFENILESGDRRLARQRRTDEITRGRDQLHEWFRNNVLKHKISVETSKADSVRWDRNNSIFADVLLRADEDLRSEEEFQDGNRTTVPTNRNTHGPLNNIPIGPSSRPSRSPSRTRQSRCSTLFPAHRAMLIRSEFFLTMFSSSFREAKQMEHLQIIPIDCSPEVLEIVLTFLYTEQADFPLDIAIDVLYAADLLFIEKLKVKAAMIISTLGNGNASIVEAENPRGETSIEDVVDIYDVVRAGWDTRVHRLEEFGARFIAHRLERYIDEPEFAKLVRDSAARIQKRQETDTVELIDDIRYYLSERFRLRFEDAGLDEMMDESNQAPLAEGEFQNVMPSTSIETALEDEGVDVSAGESKHQLGKNDATYSANADSQFMSSTMRTLDGEIAGDEFSQDAINYQILLGKIDQLLDTLKLDA